MPERDEFDLRDPDQLAEYMSLVEGRPIKSKNQAQSANPALSGPSLEDEMEFQLEVTETIPPFEREFMFHESRKWRFDFAWADRKIALEVEGGTWVGGRHNHPLGFAADAQKYNEAAILGWRVLRVTGEMVRDGQALSFVERIFQT